VSQGRCLPRCLLIAVFAAACSTQPRPSEPSQGSPSQNPTDTPLSNAPRPADVHLDENEVITGDDGVPVLTNPAADQEGKHSIKKLSTEGSRARDAHQQPDMIMEKMGLREGHAVGDIGCGAGYFTFHFSQVVGETGTVYCVDSDPNAVDYVKQRIVATDTDNVELVLSAYGDCLLDPSSVDMAFLADVHFFHDPSEKISTALLRDFVGFYASVHRAIRPGGKLVLIESTKEAGNGRNVVQADIASQLAPFGFELAAEYPMATQPQYFMIFDRKELAGLPPSFESLAAQLEQLYPGITSQIDAAAPTRANDDGLNCSPTLLATQNVGLEAGQGVRVSGTIRHLGPPSEHPAPVLLDVHSASNKTQVMYNIRCSRLGAFDAELPKWLGEVRMVAHLDVTGDGPSLDDPAGASDKALEITDVGIKGVDIVLSADTDRSLWSNVEPDMVAP